MENEWKKIDGVMLQKTWRFRDFNEALAFANKVGAVAEELQHHPDICIRNYNQVVVSTTTNDKGSTLTEKDYALAKRIDEIE